MEIKEVVAKGYVMNARSRRHQCERWTEILNAMSMGEPMTATEVAERANANRSSWYSYSAPQVSHALNALKSVGAVMRMEIAIEPYEIEVERPMVWDCGLHCYVEQPPKKITIDKKAVFIRMV